MLKLFTKRGYVKLDNDVAALEMAIEKLKQPKRERQSREEQKGSEAGLRSSGANLDSGNGQSLKSSHEVKEDGDAGL